MDEIDNLRKEMFAEAVNIYSVKTPAVIKVDEALWYGFIGTSVRAESVALSQIEINLWMK